ncbi:hypothetical protein ACQJBY_011070 [Aegilops geniculata]
MCATSVHAGSSGGLPEHGDIKGAWYPTGWSHKNHSTLSPTSSRSACILARSRHGFRPAVRKSTGDHLRDPVLLATSASRELHVRQGRDAGAGGVVLRLHHRGRRHGGVPARRHAVAALPRAPAGARRVAVRGPAGGEHDTLHGHARRHVPGVAGAAVRVRGRRHQLAPAGAGRRQLHQRRLLHARQRRVRAGRRVGPRGGQGGVPVGGGRGGVPPRARPLAGRAAEGAHGGRRRAGQRLHVRPHRRHQGRRLHIRRRGAAPHGRRPAAVRAPRGHRPAAPGQSGQDPLQRRRAPGTAGGARRGVPRLQGADAQGLPQHRPPQRHHPLGGRHGQPAAADAQRRRPRGPPALLQHHPRAEPAGSRPGHGRQPHERHLRAVAFPRRGLPHPGRRHHPVRQLHRGRQRLQLGQPAPPGLRRQPPAAPQLRHVLSTDWAAGHGATEAAHAGGHRARGGRDEPARRLGVPRRLHPGEGPWASVHGPPRAAEPQPGRQPGGDVQLLLAPGGPPALRRGVDAHRARHPVQILPELHLPLLLHGGAAEHHGGVPREPAASARQRLQVSGAVLQGHRHDHLALPRRLPGRQGRRRRVPGARRGRAARHRRLHVQRLAGNQPAGHRYDARQVYGG